MAASRTGRGKGETCFVLDPSVPAVDLTVAAVPSIASP
jgi:hypothetical protein